MKNRDELSVIIPTCDRVFQLRTCVNSLLSQTVRPDEIIIVDNSTTQSAKDAIFYFQNKFPFIRYYHCQEKGSPFTRNMGIQVSKYDLLAFLDDDCVPYKNWVREVLKCFRYSAHEIFKGKNMNGLSDNLYATVEYFQTELKFLSLSYIDNSNIYLRVVDTKNFCMSKSFIRKHNILFDTQFAPYSILEDFDFAYQLRSVGMSIRYVSSMKVRHFGRSTLLAHIKREFRKGRAAFFFRNKWNYSNESYAIRGFKHLKNHEKPYPRKGIKLFSKIQNTLLIDCLKKKPPNFIVSFHAIIILSPIVSRVGYIYEFIRFKIRDLLF